MEYSGGFCEHDRQPNSPWLAERLLASQEEPNNWTVYTVQTCNKGKAVPLHAMEALGGRGSIAPTHSRPRH